MEKRIISHSPFETQDIGEHIAKALSGGVVALFGGMGAGKTAFVRGFCKGVGYTGEVSSPTFAIVHEYVGGRVPVYHFDMYRIESEDDLYSCGYYDYLDEDGIVVVEWSENIESLLPDDCLRINFERYDSDENVRIITIYGLKE